MLACVLCAGFIAACGGGGGVGEGGEDRLPIRALVQDMQVAAKEGDSARICNELFTEDFKNSIGRGSQSCADQVTETLASDGAAFQVEELDVIDGRANAVLIDESGSRLDVAFERVGGDWRIARIEGLAT